MRMVYAIGFILLVAIGLWMIGFFEPEDYGFPGTRPGLYDI